MSTFGKTYRVIVEPDDPKGWVAIVPAVPGLVAHGETQESAMDLLKEELQAHLRRLEEEEQPLPEDSVAIFWDESDEASGAKLLTIEV